MGSSDKPRGPVRPGVPKEPPEDQQPIALGVRPETGPMRFGYNYPGLYIRGDHANQFRIQLEAIVNTMDNGNLPKADARSILRGLIALFAEPVEVMARAQQHTVQSAHLLQARQRPGKVDNKELSDNKRKSKE